MRDANLEYVLHYRHAGQLWTMSFFAADDADADAKVSSIRASLELKGRLLGRGETISSALESAAHGETSSVLRRLRHQT